MLIQQTLERLHELRLTGMAQALEEQLRMLEVDTLGFDDRLALLLERELTARDDRRLARLLQVAKLHVPACVEDLDFKGARGLDRSLVLRLASGQWIREHDNVLIVGATGTGKSYLACALGHSACRQGFSTRYFRSPGSSPRSRSHVRTGPIRSSSNAWRRPSSSSSTTSDSPPSVT